MFFFKTNVYKFYKMVIGSNENNWTLPFYVQQIECSSIIAIIPSLFVFILLYTLQDTLK